MFWLLACAAEPVFLKDGVRTTESDPPAWEVALEGPDAVDPLLQPTLLSRVASAEGDAVRVEILDAAGAVVATLADGSTLVEEARWDLAATPAPVGAYTQRATLLAGGAEVAVAERPVWVVRVGVVEGRFGGADRIPLLWHDAGGDGQYWSDQADGPLFSLAAIDDGATATPFPPLWGDLESPPEDVTGATLPAAYPWDARPTLLLRPAGDAAGAPVALGIEGWTCVDQEDGSRACTADAPLASSVGIHEAPLALTWSTSAGEFARQSLPVRLYLLLGPPGFERTEVPYQPWVAVVDDVLGAIQGVEPTEAAVTGAIVKHVFRDLSLAYDTRSGASAYVQYDWNSYNDATLDLSGFLSRRRGSIVNCTDCAGIVEAFSNMLGAPLSYSIILSNFDLNYIEAIGYDEFTHCPFGNRGCGFSYHAVTTPDDAATIFDATLALDGDDDPGSTPNVELLVQGVAGDEYLDRLVMSGNPRYDYTQQGSLR